MDLCSDRGIHLQEFLLEIKEKIFPLGSKRRSYYDKFWDVLNVKSQGLSSKILNKTKKIFFKNQFVKFSGFRKLNANCLREQYFKMLFRQTKRKSDENVDYKLHDFKEYPIKLIAFYLPQFHPIPENDLFWGKGFTEWSNVSAAVPQFMSHYQPHLPGDLGFYDLRLVENIKKQVRIAKNYGIYAFCFHHYWFDGKGVMRTPIDLFLKHKEIDFKFCISWANENWTRAWDGLDTDILLKQNHTPEDDIKFIKDTSKYMRDSRYLRIDGKPLLIIYRPTLFPDPKETVERWRKWCRNNNLGEIFLVSIHSFDKINPEEIGFDATIEYPPNLFPIKKITHHVDLVNRDFEGLVLSYNDLIKLSKNFKTPTYKKFRGICPTWDNEARRPGRGTIIFGSNPEKYQAWLEYLLDYTYKQFDKEERILLINAWNEWAEGDHLEPDRRFGYAYLESTAKALENFLDESKRDKIIIVSHDAYPHGAQYLALNLVKKLKNHFDFSVITILGGEGKLKSNFMKYSKVIEWFELNPQEKSKILKSIFNNGFRKAITNTSSVGEIVEYLKNTGFNVISLIHEMEKLIRNKKLEDSARKIALNSDLLIFAAQPVLKSFSNVVEQIPTDLKIRSQGLYKNNIYMHNIQEIRKKLRKSYKIDKDSLIILNVGYADYRKGFDIFIEIGRKVLDKYNNVYFFWVGLQEGEIFKQSIKKIEKSKRKHFIFPGFVNDIDFFYAAADIFLLTSREDPYPSVILEAFDVGLPVIAFKDAGGFDELLEDIGGLLVPYLDIESAAKRLINFMKDKSQIEKIGKKCKDIIQDRFYFLDYIHDLLDYLNIYAPKISVIIPNYNYEKYIPSRINSIFKQNYKPYEIIFLDDVSQDNSVDIAIKKLNKSDIKKKIIINRENIGCFKQWCKGINNINGEIIWIAETDDIAEPKFLKKLKNFFKNKEVMLAYCQSKIIDEKSNIIGSDYLEWTNDISKTKWKKTYCNDGEREVIEALSIKNTIPNASAVLMRKEALLGINEYLEAFETSGDWFTYLYVLKRGKICYTTKKLNLHRRHSNSIIAKYADSYIHFDDNIKILEFIIENYELPADQLSRILNYLDTSYKQLLSDKTGYQTINLDPRYSKKLEDINEKFKD